MEGSTRSSISTTDRLDGSEPAETAIPILVDAYGGRLYSIGLRFCGDPGEAEDVVQETFLQAYRNWDSFEGRSKASTWLFTIASRVCQRMHRRRAGEPERVLSLDLELPFEEAEMNVVPEAADGLDAQIRKEARLQVEAAIAELPKDFRMPFVLKEIAGLALEDVAAVLDLKKATVKTRVHRARLRVRDAVARALPRREVPPAVYSKQICLDLLQSKLDALDREVAFDFPDGVVCQRCSELFATLDLSSEVCRRVAEGRLPQALREELIERLAAAGR